MEDFINTQTVGKISNHKYHHGDLHNALLMVARTMLEEQNKADLSLRAIARKAGVSHAAPYRHFKNLQALLVELAKQGFSELRNDIASTPTTNRQTDKIASLCKSYMGFVSRHPSLVRLMFGSHILDRPYYHDLKNMSDRVVEAICIFVESKQLGLVIWATLHGITMLALENIIDVGQDKFGLSALSSRTEDMLCSIYYDTWKQEEITRKI